MRGTSTRLLLAVIASAVFLSVLIQTFVNVVVPLIQEDYGVSEGEVGWVITGYLLVFAVGIPLYGRIADLYSIRRTFSVGLLGLAAGSVLCAAAPSFPVLVGGRMIQAAGAAAIPALSFAIVAKILPPGRRGVAFGLISSSIGVGASVGPPVGGALAGIAGWHSLFVVAFLLSALLAAGAWLTLPEKVSDETGEKGFDLTGGALLALAAGSALFAVTEGQVSGFASPVVGASFVVAAVCAAAFVRRIRTAAEPFVSPGLFRNGGFVATAMVGFFTMFANIGSLVMVPLLLTEANSLPPVIVGLALAPGAVAVALLSPLAGRLSDRLGFRSIVQCGLMVMLASSLIISTLGAGGSALVVAFGMLVLGIGFSFVNSPNANAASASLSASQAGVGLGIYQMTFFLGGGFGPALAGAFLAYRQSNAATAANPIYSLDFPAFSDAFLLLGAALVLALVASGALAKKKVITETTEKGEHK